MKVSSGGGSHRVRTGCFKTRQRMDRSIMSMQLNYCIFARVLRPDILGGKTRKNYGNLPLQRISSQSLSNYTKKVLRLQDLFHKNIQLILFAYINVL